MVIIICLFQDALSVKGDAYWVATEKLGTMKKKFLICFDFTKERLGEGLQSLPFDSCESVIVILKFYLVLERNRLLCYFGNGMHLRWRYGLQVRLPLTR